MAGKYTYTVGKKKTASAQVRLFEGTWESTINQRKVNEYVTRSDLFEVVYSPLKLCKSKDTMYFEVTVAGSGESSQAYAMRHALARALAEKDAENKKILKAAGMLTRDARIVERKKPGKKKARKSPSWSKR